MSEVQNKVKVKRVLWLTDTFIDHNGVSMVLQAMHREIRERDLPIDILVCSNDIEPDDHLIVLKPVSEFNIPLYRQQALRIPNYLNIRRIFKRGKYDRVLCSTEGPMGFAAIYLKKLYSVRTDFYMHTDWIMFARQIFGMEELGVKNIQRLARIYYNLFDNIFVLNRDQQQWLTGDSMRFDPSRIFLTAHWVEEVFINSSDGSRKIKDPQKPPVILFAGRLSREKGIFELPDIFRNARTRVPGLKMLIAGTGPSENELKKTFPEAEYTGWVNHDRLPEIYHSADLLILPSRFDTFSCVVIEAFSCGLPVIAYNTKGPKDIIQDSVNGFLINNTEEIVERIVEFFLDEMLQDSLKMAARERAGDYTPDAILQGLLKDLGINLSGPFHEAFAN
jgi:glycosyltransferase involved in cell wall biosynthesis